MTYNSIVISYMFLMRGRGGVWKEMEGYNIPCGLSDQTTFLNEDMWVYTCTPMWGCGHISIGH